MKICEIFVRVALALLTISVSLAGDTYNVINSKGDYINYGSASQTADPREVISRIIIAPDSARYEPRWQAMLDPNDLKALIFEQVRQNNGNIYINR